MDRYTSNKQFEDPSLVEMVLEEFHETLYPIAVGLCRSFGFDSDYADDLMQDFYFTVMRKGEDVKKGLEEHGIKYLKKMLRNELINQKRKRTATDRRETYFSEQNSHIPNPFSLCSDEYQESFFRDLEKILTDTELEIMILYIKGYTYKEISEQLDMPKGTIASKISRAKKKIAKLYGWPRNDRKKKENQNQLF